MTNTTNTHLKHFAAIRATLINPKNYTISFTPDQVQTSFNIFLKIYKLENGSAEIKQDSIIQIQMIFESLYSVTAKKEKGSFSFLELPFNHLTPTAMYEIKSHLMFWSDLAKSKLIEMGLL